MLRTWSRRRSCCCCYRCCNCTTGHARLKPDGTYTTTRYPTLAHNTILLNYSSPTVTQDKRSAIGRKLAFPLAFGSEVRFTSSTGQAEVRSGQVRLASQRCMDGQMHVWGRGKYGIEIATGQGKIEKERKKGKERRNKRAVSSRSIMIIVYIHTCMRGHNACAVGTGKCYIVAVQRLVLALMTAYYCVLCKRKQECIQNTQSPSLFSLSLQASSSVLYHIT